MDRDAALALAREHTTKDITYRHLISVGGVMRSLARHFGQDETRWELAGIFHDLDYDVTAEDFDRHTHLTLEWLDAAGYDDAEVKNAILGHKYPDHRTDLMSRAIVHADAVAGLLVATALVRPEKVRGMKVSSVKKKLKQNAFAPGVERDEIWNVEESIGIPLDDFLAMTIAGLEEIGAEIELV